MATITTKCGDCGWTYPTRLLNPMRSNDGTTPAICGICALARKNRIHGTSFETFSGDFAEQLRLEALEWRRRNPDMAGVSS